MVQRKGYSKFLDIYFERKGVPTLRRNLKLKRAF